MNLFGAKNFLKNNPEMSFLSYKNNELTLQGIFRFRAKYGNHPVIEDYYNLKIQIPKDFPYQLPKITELDKKIPREHTFHLFIDNTLCVCHPMKPLLKLGKSPTIVAFVRHFLIPYLSNVSYKLEHGGRFITGELGHGIFGLLDGYLRIFNLNNPHQVIATLKILTLSKKEANNYTCP